VKIVKILYIVFLHSTWSCWRQEQISQLSVWTAY